MSRGVILKTNVDLKQTVITTDIEVTNMNQNTTLTIINYYRSNQSASSIDRRNHRDSFNYNYNNYKNNRQPRRDTYNHQISNNANNNIWRHNETTINNTD